MADEKKRSEDYWIAVIQKEIGGSIRDSRLQCRVSRQTKEYKLLGNVSEKLQLGKAATLRLFLRYLYDNPAMAGAAARQLQKENREKQRVLDEEKKQRDKAALKAEKALDKQVQKMKDSNKKDPKNDGKSKRNPRFKN